MLYRDTSRTHPDAQGVVPRQTRKGKLWVWHCRLFPEAAASQPLPTQPAFPVCSSGAGQALPSPTTESWASALGHSCPWAPYSFCPQTQQPLCPLFLLPLDTAAPHSFCPLYLRLGWAVNECGKRHLAGSSSCCRHPPRKNNRLERSRSNTTIGLLWLKWSQEFSAWFHLPQAKQRATNKPVWQLSSWHPAAKATRTC